MISFWRTGENLEKAETHPLGSEHCYLCGISKNSKIIVIQWGSQVAAIFALTTHFHGSMF